MQTIHYREKLYQLTSNTVWAPRISRFGFIHGNLFNWVEKPNEFDNQFNIQKVTWSMPQRKWEKKD